jgi:signal peptidase I
MIYTWAADYNLVFLILPILFGVYLLRRFLSGSSRRIKEAASYLEIIIICSLIAFLARYYALDIYRIPSDSMKNTLLAGDRVAVDKLAYGTRVFGSGNPQEYRRLKSHSAIARNDVVVFNAPGIFSGPIPEKTVLVKRCVALPGDTLNINDRTIYINNKKLAQPVGVLFAGSQNQSGRVISENKLSEDTTKSATYGPVWIPKTGMAISLNTGNLALYQDVLEVYEGCKVKISEGTILINGRKEYTIKKNYYFMMGDNRNNSQDSRQWGFVPEDQ